jgi:predicted dehydrogenase
VGAFGRNHARIYQQLAQQGEPVRLVGVVDPDIKRADAVAREFGCRAFGSVEQLVSTHSEVQAASVAVPTVRHLETARVLMEAGVDVLVEKPLAASLAEADELVKLTHSLKRVGQVGHLERFNPAVRATVPLITQPMFFEVHRLSIFTPRSLDVDVVLDLMIHDLDVILSMVPSAVRAVEAVGVPVLSSSVDIANARLRFANGCIANLTASRVSLKRERKLRIFQADAYLAVDYGERRVRVCRREPGDDGQAALVLEDREVAEIDALEAEIHAFIQAVERREPPAVSGWDGLRALEVAHVIRESLETEVRAAQAAAAR